MQASRTQPATDRPGPVRFLSPVIDLLFPSGCVSCGKGVSFHHRHICPECLDSISLPEDSCPRCSAPLTEKGCRLCTERAFYPDLNICAAEYSQAMKAALHAYKFQRLRSLSAPLTSICIDLIQKKSIRADLLTCVPMQPGKIRKRGFNQAELIARRLARALEIPFSPTLLDTGGANHQRDQGYADRFLNVIGRYKPLKGADIDGKAVIIVDDVFTTGATINECARILKKGGANRIFSLTLARTAIKRLEIF